MKKNEELEVIPMKNYPGGYTTKGSRYNYVSCKGCEGNCKFATLNNVTVLTKNQIEEKVAIIDYIMNNRKSMRVFLAHVINETSVDYLKKNFEVVSVVRIPIGYNYKYQYHVHIRNHYDTQYETRFKKEGVKNILLEHSAETVKIAEEAFRAGRKDKSYHIKTGFKKFINKK